MSWRYYHTVWFVMGFGWVSLYLVRMGLSPLLEMIMEEFHISYAVAGTLFSALFYSYGLMQLPSGYLGDRFGRRRILIIGTFLWFLISLATALAKSVTMLILMRLLVGMVHGTYFCNDRSTIVSFTPEEKMGQGQGVSFMGLGLGLFLSVFFAGIIAEYYNSWRMVFVIFSIPSLVTSLLIFKYIREPQIPPSERKGLKVRQTYRASLINRNLWLLYLVGFTFLFAYWAQIIWMPSIYSEIGIKGVADRSLLSGILGLIGIPALFVSGMYSDRLVKKGHGRKGFIAIIILLWALLMLLIGYALESKASTTLITAMFWGSAIVVFGVWPPYYALLSEMAPKETVGTTFGLANFIGFLGAWIAPALTGWIKDYTGSFSVGLYLSGILLVAGAVIILAVRPLEKEA